MSDVQETPWSNNPNAPNIQYDLYFIEKCYFAGVFISWILYGTLVVLFFRCMTVLLNPANRERDGIKWGLVSYTVVMFLVVTLVTAGTVHTQSLAYIDNREFPGGGPYKYRMAIYHEATGVIPNLASISNYWLADAFLLYRCYVVYVRNLWVISLPCLMYLASVATGILIITFQTRQLDVYNISISHLSISVSLNILLTITIVIRLVLHSRNDRAVMGSQAGIGGLYKTIATMLIESCALYAVTSLLLIGLWANRSDASNIFVPIHAETQVIAPLLIVQRVANRNALTSNTIVSGGTSSFRVRSRHEPTGGSYAFPGGSADDHGRDTVELEIVVEGRDNPQDSRV